jgi:steroid delta-isomerase-like uncharacterized protein
LTKFKFFIMKKMPNSTAISPLNTNLNNEVSAKIRLLSQSALLFTFGDRNMKIISITLAAILATCSFFATPAAYASKLLDRPVVSERQVAKNKAAAIKVYEEGLSQGKFEVAYTKDFVGRGGGSATFTHADGIKEAKGWRQAFPDLKVSVDLIVAEGDLVSVRWTARGTNSGTGNGIPATGKYVQTSGTTVFRFVDGAIAEEWTAGDALGLMKQLGLLPAPSSGGNPAK